MCNLKNLRCFTPDLEMKPIEDSKNTRIYLRLSIDQKEKWKKLCAEKNLSITDLVISSVENKISSDERRKVTAFIDKQSNLFSKIENNINQVARIVNGQKYMTAAQLQNYNQLLSELGELKREQNRLFRKIYRLLSE